VRLGGGTLAWMAPESFDGRPITAASDVYSFTVVMYEVVTGAHPYGTGALAPFIMKQKLSGVEPCRVSDKDCPPIMLNLMKRCYELNPRDRPTMEEINAALQDMPLDWPPQDSTRVVQVQVPDAELLPSEVGTGLQAPGAQSPSPSVDAVQQVPEKIPPLPSDDMNALLQVEDLHSETATGEVWETFPPSASDGMNTQPQAESVNSESDPEGGTEDSEARIEDEPGGAFSKNGSVTKIAEKIPVVNFVVAAFQLKAGNLDEAKRALKLGNLNG